MRRIILLISIFTWGSMSSLSFLFAIAIPFAVRPKHRKIIIPLAYQNIPFWIT